MKHYKLGGNYWVFLTIIILATLHLKVFVISTFQVSLGFLLIPIWLILTYDIFPYKFSFKATGLFLITSFIPFLGHSYSPNKQEFYNSYALYLLCICLIFFFWYKKTAKIHLSFFIKCIHIFQFILSVLSIAQYFSFHFLGIDSLYNIWGDNQLYYPLPPFERMKGFYLEPSYLGFVALSLFWTNLNAHQTLKNYNIITTGVILFCAKSAFAIYAIIALLAHWVLVDKKFLDKIIYILSIIVVFVIVSPWINSEALLKKVRLVEIDDTKYTSGYIRTVLPYLVLEKTWKEYNIWGLSFGQAESVLSDVIPFDVKETEINNGLYAILIYFGIFGALLYIRMMYTMIFNKSKSLRSFVLLVFLLLQNSGAIFSPQAIFLLLFFPYIIFQNHK